MAASNGGSFADNFVDYVTNNWSQALAALAVSYFVALAFEALTSPGLCFKEGTLIETEDGLKPIEEIKEGDLVLAFDEQTGKQLFKPVARLFRNTTNEWYHITVNGEEIICTAEHPFYVVGLGFVSAKNLSVKDKLLSSDNSVVDIDAITIERLTTPETTYNFEVEDFHTYYVGECAVLVHNKCLDRGPTRRKYWKQESKDLKGAGITYDPTPKNINRMEEGLAPIGFDDKKVVLHHVEGANIDMDYVVQIQQTDHIIFHRQKGYVGYGDITLLEEFLGKIV